MVLGLLPIALLLGSGALVGLTLGLIGGGGSVLAVPLLVYLVGVPSAHVAIGSSAVAVAANAAWGLAAHARLGTVKWPCALVFTTAGVAGAFIGASSASQFGGPLLLALFGLVMISIGIYMISVRPESIGQDVRLTPETARHLLPRLLLFGVGPVGLLSGFFGIGGGFLIVPGLVLATGMGLQNAIGTSLFAVTAFGLATATSYAFSGLVDWRIAALVILGGVAGTLIGTNTNAHLAGHKRALAGIFAGVVIATGLYIVGSGLLKVLAVS
ncbi:sulfite exporter TauE/SafE family protein [Methyloceanibacter superfactus]|nr:sulfite exporter TauE/SafE family protein [Methyloceanibacter superfactus]